MQAYKQISTTNYSHSFHSFPGGSDGKECACKLGDLDSIPGLGRSPGGGHGNPLQYSFLENSMDIMYYLCACVCSVMSDSLRPHGLQPSGLLYPQAFPSKNTGVGCHFLLQQRITFVHKTQWVPYIRIFKLWAFKVANVSLYGSCCTLLLYFSRCYTVRLKRLSLFSVCFLEYCLCENYCIPSTLHI